MNDPQRTAIKCGATALLISLPLAPAIAAAHRFPVPFGGYQSGIAAIYHAFMACFFYGILGLFPTIFAMGYVAWMVVTRVSKHQDHKIIFAFVSFASALIPLLVLSELDRFVGPW